MHIFGSYNYSLSDNEVYHQKRDGKEAFLKTYLIVDLHCAPTRK